MNFNEVPYRYPARSVVVDGFRVAYVDVNPDAADVAVFLHDVAGDLDDFAPVYERIGGDRRAIGMDLVGFGKSDKPPLDDPVELYTTVLGGFLSALDLERVALVGHGLGALVAARFASEHPDRVGRLVLSALPGVRDLSGDELATADDFWAFDRVSAFDDAGRRGWYEAMGAGWNDRLEAHLGIRNQLASSLGFRPWAHSVEEAARSMLRHPLGDRLGRIQAPTLLVWGVDDPVVPFADAAVAREAIPGARLTTIEECGHLSALEQPEAWAGPIAAFLAEAETPTAATGDLTRRVRDVDSWPGFTPGIGRLARMLYEQRDRCEKLTAQLSIDDVAWQPSPGANSVGALLLHMGATPMWYLYEVLRGEPVPSEVSARFHFDPDDDDAPLTAPRKSAGRLIAEVEWAHEQLAEWLHSRTDADLNRTFTPRRGGTPMTLRWILWHMAEDTVHHRGQIAYIRRLLAERSTPGAQSMYQTPPTSGS